MALGGLAVRGYELAAVTWEQAFLMCPASPDEGQGAPLRRDMLIEGIFGLSLVGLRRGTLRGGGNSAESAAPSPRSPIDYFTNRG